jgi:hypothetical protein
MHDDTLMLRSTGNRRTIASRVYDSHDEWALNLVVPNVNATKRLTFVWILFNAGGHVHVETSRSVASPFSSSSSLEMASRHYG